ncbi:hypothetical protein HMPREF9144_0595 [Prevotella pallens ATCC 700821]|uniref:Uncharacterized protein n=1 Tax=Prevotella pallens ATCC 700821 TaxID=997353 RepID=F9DG05_9BACT|nr:hypothetical protein HMPREF9144_0595 [Prevotella pallens ATCC 700821]
MSIFFPTSYIALYKSIFFFFLLRFYTFLLYSMQYFKKKMYLCDR